MTDVVNRPTVFLLVRAQSREAAARLFEGHPHVTAWPCDGVE